MASADLTIRIEGNEADAVRALSRVRSALGGVGSGIASVGKLAAGFVIGQAIYNLPGLLLDSAKAAADDAASVLKLQTAVKNAGDSWEDYAAQIDKTIAAGIRKGFSDSDQRDALALLTAQTGDAGEAMRRMELAQDLARGTGMDLTSASRLLGKVNAENVEVFKRLGITIGEGATEADAFAAIQAKFGGQSEAFANTAAGAWAAFNLQMGELQETVGGLLLPIFTEFGKVAVGAVTTLIDTVRPLSEYFKAVVEDGDYLNDMLMDLPGPIRGVVAGIGKLVAGVKDFLAYLDPSNTVDFMGNLLGPDFGPIVDEAVRGIKSVADVVGRVIELGGLLVGGKINLGEFFGSLGAALERIELPDFAAILGNVGDIASGLSDTLIEAVGQIPWGDIWTAITSAASAAGGFLVGLLGDAATLAGDIGARLIEMAGDIPWAGIWKAITDGAAAVGGFLSGLLGDLGTLAVDLGGRLVTAVGDIPWEDVWQAVTDGAKAVGGFLTGLLGDLGTLAADLGAKLVTAVGDIPWTDVWAAITEGAEKVGGFVGGLIADVVKLGTDLGTKIGEAVAAIPWAEVWANVQEGAADLQTALTDLWTGLDWTAIATTAGTALGFAETIRLWLENLIVTIQATDWTTVGDTFGETIIGVIKSMFAGSAGGEAGEAVGEGLSAAAILGILTLPLRVGQAIAGAAAEVIVGLVSALVLEWGDDSQRLIVETQMWFINLPSTLAPIILQAATDMAQSLGRGLAEGMASLGGMIAEAATNLVNGLVDTVKGLLGIASPSSVFLAIGEDIVNGLIAGVAGLADAVGDAVASITGPIADAIGTVLDSATAIGANIVTGLTTGAATLAAELATILGKITGWITSTAETILTSAAAIGASIVNGLRTGANILADKLGEIWATIDGWITQTAATILGSAEAIGRDLASGVRAGAEAIVDKLGEVWATIDGWITETAGDVLATAAGIGRNLAQGVINGIDELIGAAKAKAEEIGDIITGALKAVTGQSSPSKVTAETGRMIGEGLIAGMEARLDAVRQASKALGKSALEGIDAVVDSGMSRLGGSEIAWANPSGASMPLPAMASSDSPAYWGARAAGGGQSGGTVINNYATINTQATSVDIPTEFSLMRARHAGRY